MPTLARWQNIKYRILLQTMSLPPVGAATCVEPGNAVCEENGRDAPAARDPSCLLPKPGLVHLKHALDCSRLLEDAKHAGKSVLMAATADYAALYSKAM